MLFAHAGLLLFLCHIVAAPSVPSSSLMRISESRTVDSVRTPAPGSPARAAILDALRTRLKTRSRFKVDHIRTAGAWAFVRATEVVPLERGEQQETDLSVAALLERTSGATNGSWRIVELWTLPGNDARPLTTFSRRVKQRIAAEKLPAALLPEDL